MQGREKIRKMEEKSCWKKRKRKRKGLLVCPKEKKRKVGLSCCHSPQEG